MGEGHDAQPPPRRQYDFSMHGIHTGEVVADSTAVTRWVSGNSWWVGTQHELRGLLLRWDPILGDAEDGSFPADEYDCMIAPLLRLLRGGAAVDEVVARVREVMTDHFGLDPEGDPELHLAAGIVQWWSHREAAPGHLAPDRSYGLGMSDLRTVLLRMIVDDLATEDLPDLAAAVIAACDRPSASLDELAGAPRSDPRRLTHLFEQAVDELELARPCVEKAQWELIHSWAISMSVGVVHPYDGARAIWRACDALARPESLLIFVGLTSEWEDVPQERGLIETQLLQEATRLVHDCTGTDVQQ